jgi:hypothetical protein
LIWVVLGTIAIVAATVTVGVLADRRWGLLPHPQKLLAESKPQPRLPSYAPGEAPSTAIPASPMELEKLRRRQKCPTCRAEMDALADDEATYDGRRLIVLQFRCPRCASKISVYVAPTST